MFTALREHAICDPARARRWLAAKRVYPNYNSYPCFIRAIRG